MSYQSLARKYRPKVFGDLVGQEDVTRALLNAIKLDRPPASVIFSGIRGIGKTTAARLYAMALNCANPQSFEPCGLCDSCTAIADGHHEDVLEIDGASHNGVDEVRALKEAVSYVPHRSKYKVFLIDEVHMLSISAFNALLKTLEEPPSNVIFIFATTELQKVPATIVGRCQTFYLQKLSIPSTINRLKLILSQENISCEEGALALVAREGYGSMRDALMLLDQAIAIGDGVIRKETFENILCSASTDALISLLGALTRKNTSACIDSIASLDQAGRDFETTLIDLARLARHGFVLQGIGEQSLDKAFLDLSEAEEAGLREISRSCVNFELNRLFRMFVKCRQDMDGGNLDRFVFENYCLEWCLDPGLPDIEALLSNQEKKKSPVSSEPKDRKLKPTSLVEELNKNEASENQDSLASRGLPSIDRLGLVAASNLPESKCAASIPETWEELVSMWKSKRPLEARKFEEAYIKEYNIDSIQLMVKPHTLLAKNLQEDPQNHLIKKSLKRLFNFNGDFSIVEMDSAGTETKDLLPASILEARHKAKGQQEDEWINAAKHHPMTNEVLDKLNARLLRIELKD